MIDLKKFNKAIKVNSQEELDECYRIFEEAGADMNIQPFFARYPRNCYFTYFVFDFSGSNAYHCREIIQFKDFMKELNMNEMKYKQGDILVNIYDEYRRVLGVCGEVYFLSKLVSTQKHNDTKVYDTSITQYELDNLHYHLYTPPKEVEMTVAEISEALGKTVKVVE